MKRLLYILALLCLLLATPAPADGQNTSQGTDFWVLMLANGGSEEPTVLTVTAVGDTACTMTVENPLTAWSGTAAMAAGASASVTLPSAAVAERTLGTRLDSCAFHVTTTATVTLLASSTELASSGAALVQPTAALRSRYVVLDYPADPTRTSSTGAEVGFVAVEDNTTLGMTLPCPIPGHAAGSTLTVTLQAGQSYRLMTNTANHSFSGMEVVGDKPFAMFQGNNLCGLPYDNSGNSGDYIYEQAVPVDYWGTDYALVSSRNRSVGDRVRVTSADTASVTLSNGQSFQLVPGQCHEFALPIYGGLRLRASQPVGVALYMCNSSYGGEYGDATMTVLPSLDNGVNHADFATISTVRIGTWYVNVVVRTEHIGTMTLDGTAVPSSQFTALDTAYSYARLTLAAGVHHLDNPQGTFVAWTYGVGNVEGYSFSVGFGLEQEPEQPPVEDTLVYYDTVCQNQGYNEYGITISPDGTAIPGTWEHHWVMDNGDTVHHLMLFLTVLPLANADMTVVLIAGDTLYFHGDTLTQAGTYTYTFTAANGCDSLLVLHLEWETVGLVLSADGACPGDTVTITASGTHTAYWTSTPLDPALDVQQGQTVIAVSPQETTVYSLHAFEDGPRLASVTVGIAAPPELCIKVERPFIDFDYPVVVFTDCSEGSASSVWQFSDGVTLNTPKARRQFHHPLPDSITVTLTSCNQYDCCVDTTFSVATRIRSVWFPNVFTPGEDNNNRFGCIASFPIVEFELHIYNRLGLLVYSTTDPAALWDGTRDGQPLPQGAYSYYWRVRDDSDYHHSGAGTVLLLW